MQTGLTTPNSVRPAPKFRKPKLGRVIRICLLTQAVLRLNHKKP